MSKLDRSLAVTSALSTIAAGPLLMAQTIDRKGGELQINAYTFDFQMSPSVDFAADGGFVITWVSYGQDSSDNGIFARRFSATGIRLASEFQINTYTSGDQRYPAVASTPGGAFVVAWTSKGQDGADYGIFARRFGSSGLGQASEFQVNTRTEDQENYATVAVDGDGDFVIAWSGLNHDGYHFGVFAQRFDSSGVPRATEFQVNSYTPFAQRVPVIAAESDGDFVVVWESASQDGPGAGIFARRFDSGGAALALEFRVNFYTPSSQVRPAVAMDAGGDFVITWQSYGQDGANYGIFARTFDASGTPQASEFQVNLNTALSQRDPVVAADDDGDFVVTWTSYGQDGANSGVFARRFDSAGTPQASELQINSYTAGFQRAFAIGTDGDGEFLITWDSIDQDGSGEGVFASDSGRRLSSTSTATARPARSPTGCWCCASSSASPAPLSPPEPWAPGALGVTPAPSRRT